MAKQLTASPISDSDEEFLFIPSTGPEAAPPLYPAAFFTRALIGATAVVGIEGTHPGPLEYPGADFFPGSGSDLVGITVVPKTLTGVPA